MGGIPLRLERRSAGLKPVRYLLDTNAWLRLFQYPDEINASVRAAVNAEQVLALSPFSLIEVAQKNARPGCPLNLRVPLEQWFTLALPANRLRLLPITPGIAARAYELGPDFQGDPADRVIAATSLVHDLILVTSDKKLLENPGLHTLSTR